MFDVRRGTRLSADDQNGYVENDPTGRYGRFDEVLGKGAMKTVYMAFDKVSGREVAWNQAKLCVVMQSPEILQRMYSEVNLLSTLSHHSIIRFHASWIDIAARTFNFITEMFTSGTLREYRQRYRQVEIRAVKNWARQILHGLIYLHNHDPPVIHRDLKCDNIFVNGHLGQVKIGDLGLAAILRESQSAHSIIGTPEFMAPELYEEEYNELVDIYSFGMCVLEMLTAEYPYRECTNPAQIYKKVTSGKLPDAFCKLKDSEARRFIGRCLEKASKRPSAEELLSDPFLQYDGCHSSPAMPASPAAMVKGSSAESPRRGREIVAGDEQHTDMIITGNMMPDDDAIYLKVQIADKDGHVNNIYFPFDIISDTPIAVANEMVKELEITDWEPTEIAEMISREIMNLVPQGREGFDVYNFVDDGYDDEGYNHPFHRLSSSSSTSSSTFGVFHSHDINLRLGNPFNVAEWLRDDASSVHSGSYSAINYNSGNEQDCELSYEQPKLISSPEAISKSTRLCLNDSHCRDTLFASKLQRQCALVQPPPDTMQRSANRSGKRPVEDNRRLLRNRSMMDIKSQLLHKALVKEMTKRLFKTVGAVENIGFQMPSDGSHRNYSKQKGDDKKQNKECV